MSGASPSPAEQHLGDRLAALVDGELSHDARERVLAHLATCAKCKAEADAQRRVKSLFVESAMPAPSAGLMARLQGLPGQPGPPGGDGGPSSPLSGDPFATFGYAVPPAAVAPHQPQGFRIHEVGRPRRRFAFVAAGAVSLAALALGGPLPLEAVEPNMRGEGGANVTPATQPGVGGQVPSVADAVVRDRRSVPAGTAASPSATPPGPLAPTSSVPPWTRPVSLSR
ncbi:zf-HC2 domain-containing protein [Streptomyces sp. NPDC090022]|uniref:zf-HC2 domain-containing protein n=1 Tax=Streptomyces sp. NPDC090022 TaxID=3365920 RepID=UPI0038260BA3